MSVHPLALTGVLDSLKSRSASCADVQIICIDGNTVVYATKLEHGQRHHRRIAALIRYGIMARSGEELRVVAAEEYEPEPAT